MIIWKLEAIFPNKEKLIAFEGHSREADGEHLRKIKYQFMNEDRSLIFRVDKHESKIPILDCPHLHPGPTGEPLIEDGSNLLVEDNSLRDFDFLRMWSWVQDYIQEGRVPWRT